MVIRLVLTMTMMIVIKFRGITKQVLTLVLITLITTMVGNGNGAEHLGNLSIKQVSEYFAGFLIILM